MALLLCIETATPVCSVALFSDEKLISFREVNDAYRHAESLTVFISEVVQSAEVKLHQLDAIAVSSGPGSYTGLRIGVSAVKGLCFSLDKPLISIPTLDAMIYGDELKAISLEQPYLLCPMIDARRMEVYCALYDQKLNSVQTNLALIVDEHFLNSFTKKYTILYFGDGAEKCKSVLSKDFIFVEALPSARWMSHLALQKFNSGLFENLSTFEPYYLKPVSIRP